MYDLHNLGWSSFQDLCLTIAREVLGQSVESFLDSNDGGRDGAFTGEWNPACGESLFGRFVIQCKFTSRPNYNLKPSDVTNEVSKVEALVQRGLCDSYVLMTNAGLSGKHAAEIESIFSRAGASKVVLLGATWIEQQIRGNQRLRMLVPRIYGLGDLGQILDERAYRQARAILESLRGDLGKVVVTDAYRKAAASLDDHGFVFLVGEPAAGKTTIASMLAIAAVDRWNASMLKLDDPGKVVERWNPDEPSQFFWVDDAFGVTQHENWLVHGWNHILPQVKTMLRSGAKFVMTSRDYIYKRARNDLKESAFPLLKESQVVIDVHDLSEYEKQQILYNHLKLGRQPSAFLAKIKPHLDAVAVHPRFIPETARRLGDPFFTKWLAGGLYGLEQFVDKREGFLSDILQGLDRHSKAALALIFMRNDDLETPIDLQKSEKDALERLGSDLGGAVSALEALNGSLVVHSHASGDALWRFKHPTIGDAYAAILANSPDLLGIYVQGSTPDKLIDQVTCGDVALQGAVVIPNSLFRLMIDKLSQFSASKAYKSAVLSAWRTESALQRFLARRCSKQFLDLYLGENHHLLEKVAKPGLYLHAASEVDLAVRLHEIGLLPEDARRQFVMRVSEYAVCGEDVYGMEHSGIRSIFKDDEFEQLVQEVRAGLLPRLDDVRSELELAYGSDQPSDEYMQQHLDLLETLKNYFGDEVSARELTEREIGLVNQWVADHASDEPEMQSRALGEVGPSGKPVSIRSIFDDVDA